MNMTRFDAFGDESHDGTEMWNKIAIEGRKAVEATHFGDNRWLWPRSHGLDFRFVDTSADMT